MTVSGRRLMLRTDSGRHVVVPGFEEQQKRRAVVPHETETLEQLEPTLTRLAQRLVLADRLCDPPRADRASYTTRLDPGGHKPRVPMIAFMATFP